MIQMLMWRWRGMPRLICHVVMHIHGDVADDSRPKPVLKIASHDVTAVGGLSLEKLFLLTSPYPTTTV